mmetsp:Transcript_143204/g.249897  ORF Transcript_143204/g.249897 Transcript_143204/m.249897 type:complete len:284 (-) Transcript_143204:1221-2072(-)
MYHGPTSRVVGVPNRQPPCRGDGRHAIEAVHDGVPTNALASELEDLLITQVQDLAKSVPGHGKEHHWPMVIVAMEDDGDDAHRIKGVVSHDEEHPKVVQELRHQGCQDAQEKQEEGDDVDAPGILSYELTGDSCNGGHEDSALGEAVEDQGGGARDEVVQGLPQGGGGEGGVVEPPQPRAHLHLLRSVKDQQSRDAAGCLEQGRAHVPEGEHAADAALVAEVVVGGVLADHREPTHDSHDDKHILANPREQLDLLREVEEQVDKHNADAHDGIGEREPAEGLQ